MLAFLRQCVERAEIRSGADDRHPAPDFFRNALSSHRILRSFLSPARQTGPRTSLLTGNSRRFCEISARRSRLDLGHLPSDERPTLTLRSSVPTRLPRHLRRLVVPPRLRARRYASGLFYGRSLRVPPFATLRALRCACGPPRLRAICSSVRAPFRSRWRRVLRPCSFHFLCVTENLPRRERLRSIGLPLMRASFRCAVRARHSSFRCANPC